MVAAIFRQFAKAPLAQTTVALYELPMQYPSVRWQQLIPTPPTAESTPVDRQQANDWLLRTVLLLLEDQLPLLTRELQLRVIGRLDEFVDYRINADKFAQQSPPHEEGGLLLAELDTRILPGRTPRFQVSFQQRQAGRSTYSVLATLLDGFTTDTVRIMPAAQQGWACIWLTYLVQWYLSDGPTALRGKLSRHPAFFTAGGTPEASDFPTDRP